MNIHAVKKFKDKLNSVLESMRQFQEQCQSIQQEDVQQPGHCTNATASAMKAVLTDPLTGDTEKIEFDEPLSREDMAIIGLALCRLGTAASDYIASDGEDEEDTFPCGEEEDEVQANIARVKVVLSRSVELVEVFHKLHTHMLASAIRDFVNEKEAEFRSIYQQFLESSK